MVTVHGAITLGRRRRWVDLPGIRLIEAAYEPGRVMRPHAHRNANISLVVEGGFEETVDATSVEVGSCSLVVKPPGTVHSNRYGARPSRSMIIEIEPGRERELTGGRSMGPVRWIQDGPAIAAAMDVFRAFVNSEDDLVPCIDRALKRIIEITMPATTGPGPEGQRTLRRAESYLRSHLTETPSSRKVAAAAGVHPVYLARLFRAARGCGVSEYRRQLQAGDAARRVIDSGAGLSGVAAACGFADQSHMCRVFREQLGMTPGGLRKLVRA